jgi:hypothetical protein
VVALGLTDIEVATAAQPVAPLAIDRVHVAVLVGEAEARQALAFLNLLDAVLDDDGAVTGL